MESKDLDNTCAKSRNVAILSTANININKSVVGIDHCEQNYPVELLVVEVGRATAAWTSYLDMLAIATPNAMGQVPSERKLVANLEPVGLRAWYLRNKIY